MLRRCLLLTLCAALCGCQQTPPPAKAYPVRGTIVSVDRAHGSLLLQHGAIAGYMEAMTMSYPLRQPDTLSELHPGDRINATLHVAPSSTFLDDIVVTAQANPNALPAIQYHVPTAGDAVPDFTFLNQSGRTIHLSQFRGKAIALTFIYTRCPLADFCPRMSHNFFLVEQALLADPRLLASTHLLSLSFDPAYDTPAVLRSYGGAVTGRFTGETFTHWDFAAPHPASELGRMSQFFDLGVQPGDHGTLNHSLSTVVIDRTGHVSAFFPTNDWTPDQLLTALRTAAAL